MAFSASNLSLLSTANAFQLWQYKSTADAVSAITAANYFDNAVDELRVGDLIVVRDSGDAVALVRVSANDGTTVTVSYTTGWVQQAKINDPSGGATVDSEARTAINAIIDALEAIGISSAA
ncbi:MAG: hypothetical protein IH999_05630 [Proteobacteria bacterium]|nr:hypothetical protein [Pseudomonadota bacterium]